MPRGCPQKFSRTVYVPREAAIPGSAAPVGRGQRPSRGAVLRRPPDDQEDLIGMGTCAWSCSGTASRMAWCKWTGMLPFAESGDDDCGSSTTGAATTSSGTGSSSTKGMWSSVDDEKLKACVECERGSEGIPLGPGLSFDVVCMQRLGCVFRPRCTARSGRSPLRQPAAVPGRIAPFSPIQDTVVTPSPPIHPQPGAAPRRGLLVRHRAGL